MVCVKCRLLCVVKIKNKDHNSPRRCKPNRIFGIHLPVQARSERGFDWFDPQQQPPAIYSNDVVLTVNCLTFLLKYNGICTKMSHFRVKLSQNFQPLPRPLPTTPYPPQLLRCLDRTPSGMSGYGPPVFGIFRYSEYRLRLGIHPVFSRPY